MTRKQKRMLIRILIAAVLFLAALITDHTLHPSMWIVLPIFAAAYLVVGWDILWVSFLCLFLHFRRDAV